MLFATPEIRTINGHSYLYGVESCDNAHICPVCTTRRMANARSELLMKMTHNLDGGGSFIYGVFTLPLRNGHDLDYRYRLLNEVKKRFRRYLRPLELRNGIRYSSRYLDEAWGEKHGWNPHFNWVFFLPEQVGEPQAKEFMDEVKKLWIKAAAKGGLRGVSPLSQNLEWVTNQVRAVQLAKYITHHSYYPITLRLGELKRDGKWKGLLPFEVLEVGLKVDDRLKTAWIEFEKASKGLHRVHHYSNQRKPSKGSIRSEMTLDRRTDDDFS